MKFSYLLCLLKKSDSFERLFNNPNKYLWLRPYGIYMQLYMFPIRASLYQHRGLSRHGRLNTCTCIDFQNMEITSRILAINPV